MSHQAEAPGELACFVISVAARLLGVHPQTLRYYERAGLIQPSRSRGNIRLYSARDIERAQQIKRLIEDLASTLPASKSSSTSPSGCARRKTSWSSLRARRGS